MVRVGKMRAVGKCSVLRFRKEKSESNCVIDSRSGYEDRALSFKAA